MKSDGHSPPSHWDKQQYSFFKRKGIPLLNNLLSSLCPHPSEDLYSPPFPLGQHIPQEQAPPPTAFPPNTGRWGLFSDDPQQMAPWELRCPRILSSWLPWLIKTDNSNASVRGLHASPSFFLQQQQQRHFKGTDNNHGFLDLPWLAIRSSEELIPQPWRQIHWASHVSSNWQSRTLPEMSVFTQSEKQERKCRRKGRIFSFLSLH